MDEGEDRMTSSLNEVSRYVPVGPEEPVQLFEGPPSDARSIGLITPGHLIPRIGEQVWTGHTLYEVRMVIHDWPEGRCKLFCERLTPRPSPVNGDYEQEVLDKMPGAREQDWREER